jgi:hypothetical protein
MSRALVLARSVIASCVDRRSESNVASNMARGPECKLISPLQDDAKSAAVWRRLNFVGGAPPLPSSIGCGSVAGGKMRHRLLGDRERRRRKHEPRETDHRRMAFNDHPAVLPDGSRRELNGRGERIRTSDSCVPNAVLYQAELHPDVSARQRSTTTRPAPAVSQPGINGRDSSRKTSSLTRNP